MIPDSWRDDQRRVALFSRKYSCVIKIKFSYSHGWRPLRILKALKQIKMAWEFVKVTADQLDVR